MERIRTSTIFLLIIVAATTLDVCQAQLSTTFYSKSCPNVAQIVKAAMQKKFGETRVVAAGMLRLFFHDCIIEGCDASVVIASTRTNKAEKDADDNLSLPGDAFDAVFKAKAAVDQKCPNVVSCADVLVMATNELLQLIGGRGWAVRLGRRDGKTSLASRVPGNLPSVNMSVSQLTTFFKNRGFTQREMVVLSGGHSAGFAHCNKFMDRIYDPIDRTMDTTYARNLRGTCPRVNLDPTVVANLDVTTSTAFDNVYYKNLQTKQGLLRSDQVLYTDATTKKIVDSFASNNGAFLAEFAAVMDKLSGLNVKTGSNGEIRRNCGVIN